MKKIKTNILNLKIPTKKVNNKGQGDFKLDL